MYKILWIILFLFCNKDVLSYDLVEDGDYLTVFNDDGYEIDTFNKHEYHITISEDGDRFSVERIKKKKIEAISGEEIALNKKKQCLETPTIDSFSDIDDFISEEEILLLDKIEKDYFKEKTKINSIDDVKNVNNLEQENLSRIERRSKLFFNASKEKTIDVCFGQSQSNADTQHEEGFYPYPLSATKTQQRLSPFQKSQAKKYKSNLPQQKSISTFFVKKGFPDLKRIERKNKNIHVSQKIPPTLNDNIEGKIEDDLFLHELDEIENNFQTQENNSFSQLVDKDFQDSFAIKRIYSKDEHRNLLIKMLESAEQTVLITTQSVTFFDQDIFNLFERLREKKVKIFVYYNKFIDKRLLNFFDNIGIIHRQFNIHAKFLMIDYKSIVIGSYNWLDFNDDYDNTSFEIQGNVKCFDKLRGRIWKKVIDYRKNRDNVDNPFQIDLLHESEMHLLTSLKSHENFFRCVCKNANHKIEIFSPFVTTNNAKKRLIDIASFIKEGVKINIYVLNQSDAEKLSQILKTPLLSKIKDQMNVFLTEDHSKTLVVDDYLISEGSFNWLSSASSEASKFHNFDASLVLKGRIAENFIQELNVNLSGE
ncbi:MAG: hypothetical protein Q8L85_01610 [Alphaproteobacteria bacterium]|nr:hypothetical protein [Alphaproteobacteria bacterium]